MKTAAAPRLLNAVFPQAIAVAAGVATVIEDDRAAAWLARRLPQAMPPSGELLAMTPWPLSEELGGLGTAPRLPAVEGRAWLDDAQEWAERSAHALLAASRAGDSVIHQELTLPRDFGTVRDWLAALPETDPRMLDKLPRVTWDQAVEHARAYHERLKRSRLRIAGDEGTVDPVPSVAGHRWLHLVTPEALDAESAAMGHCVGDGGYDHLTWERGRDGLPERSRCARDAAAGIWSLRDRDGRSVLTAEVHSAGYVAQIQRRFNETPQPEDTPHVLVLLDRLRAAMPDLDDPDWIVRDERDGSRHHLHCMPDGIHLKGPISPLNPCDWRRLPTAMRIEGHVVLRGAYQGVLDLDMGLHVVGRLLVRGGLRLTGELVVEGDLDLRAADVKEAPQSARVTGKVLTESEPFSICEPFSIWTDICMKSVGDIVDRMGMTWLDLAADFSEGGRERVRAGVTYEQVEIRRTPEPAVPRYLQGAPHYRQIEHRGGRRPLR
ncbi:hypothetical protein ACIQW5_06745 [Methylorubrum thiocyanatum]|uniref:hypothetical protein n=1 Tax=Methylorubrum thiocyanatum TaxID=47958 RepID=UPI00383B6BAD